MNVWILLHQQETRSFVTSTPFLWNIVSWLSSFSLKNASNSYFPAVYGSSAILWFTISIGACIISYRNLSHGNLAMFWLFYIVNHHNLSYGNLAIFQSFLQKWRYCYKLSWYSTIWLSSIIIIHLRETLHQKWLSSPHD